MKISSVLRGRILFSSASVLIAAFVFLTIAMPLAQASCLSNSPNVAPTQNGIYVDSRIIVRSVKPTFWGFNVDLIAFQNDFWDKDAQQIRSELLEELSGFPRAIYRYPGGTISNHFDWKSTVGPREKRLQQKLVSWRDPHIVDFGFDEFMSFVRDAKGTPWVTVNLHGDFDKELAIEGLGKSSSQWVNYADSKFHDLPVIKWELGNELYYSWSPQKYVGRSRRVISDMGYLQGKNRFVAILEDYKLTPYFPGLTLAEYNTIVAASLGQEVSEYSLHQYYESLGAVQQRLSYICETIAVLKKVKKNGDIGIWITESGRWPPGEKEKNWSSFWWRASSLEAAISVADYFIGTIQIPEVNGVIMHTLAGNTGPWQMFHIDKDKQLHPSAVFSVLKMLRENYQSEVLFTRTSLVEGSGNVHAAAFSNKSRTKYSLWATNSSGDARPIDISFVGHGGQIATGTITVLSNPDMDASNSERYDTVLPQQKEVEIMLNENGKGEVNLPPNSVVALNFSIEVSPKKRQVEIRRDRVGNVATTQLPNRPAFNSISEAHSKISQI